MNRATMLQRCCLEEFFVLTSKLEVFDEVVPPHTAAAFPRIGGRHLPAFLARQHAPAVFAKQFGSSGISAAAALGVRERKLVRLR